MKYSWFADYDLVFTRILEPIIQKKLENVNQVLYGALFRLFLSSSFVDLFALESSRIITNNETLSKIFNQISSICDLSTFSEKCVSLYDSAIVTGSPLVICAALTRYPSGFDRLVPACNALLLLDFHQAGKDAYFLVSEVARNFSLTQTSQAYKLDRARFIASRLEQVIHELQNPRERLACAACSDAFRCCANINNPDKTYLTLDVCGLKGQEVDWIKANLVTVDFKNLFSFVDEMRFTLWPKSRAFISNQVLTMVKQEQELVQDENEEDLFVAI